MRELGTYQQFYIYLGVQNVFKNYEYEKNIIFNVIFFNNTSCFC